MLQFKKQIFLAKDRASFTDFSDLFLGNLLDCDHFTQLFVSAKHHFSVGSFT
jgi:hypothetical protein